MGQPLAPGDFNGGNETNSYLQRLGFEITRPGDSPNQEHEPKPAVAEGPREAR